MKIGAFVVLRRVSTILCQRAPARSRGSGGSAPAGGGTSTVLRVASATERSRAFGRYAPKEPPPRPLVPRRGLSQTKAPRLAGHDELDQIGDAYERPREVVLPDILPGLRANAAPATPKLGDGREIRRMAEGYGDIPAHSYGLPPEVFGVYDPKLATPEEIEELRRLNMKKWRST